MATPAGPLLDSPAKDLPGKTLAGHTFLVTISPKGDISESSENAVLKWAIKSTQYMYAVAERGKSGQRHLHMSLIFEQPRGKQTLQEDIWKRYVKKWHGDSIGKYAVVVTNMYNHDWYDSYLRKEGGVEVLVDAYDREAITPMFPTQEQQQLYQSLAGKKVADSLLHDHCVAWEDTTHAVSVAGALFYFRERMFVKRDMAVVMDERRLRQMALALYRYRAQDITLSHEDEEFLNRSDPHRGAVYEIMPQVSAARRI